VAIAALRLEGVRRDLQSLRSSFPSEREATGALGDLAQDVPEIEWDERDLLAPPRLRP